MRISNYVLVVLFGFGSSLFTQHALAQTLITDETTSYHARVLSIPREYQRDAYEGRTHAVQEVEAQIVSGDRVGERVRFQNDYIQLKPNQSFYLNRVVDPEGGVTYLVFDVDRKQSLFLLFVFFAALVVLFGGLEGFRSLIALCLSIFAIVFVLIPLMVAGYNPLLVSVCIGSLILASAIFSTHGFNRQSYISLAGTISAVVITGLLAWVASYESSLTGKVDEIATYLDLNSGQGHFNFFNLLIASMIIGALGVLDDIAVTQVAVIGEIHAANRQLSKRQLYVRGLRVGRAHVGALVNTLVLAYVAVALPSVMLMFQNDTSLLTMINMEYFATEIVRSLVGSIGLICAVPITTALAVHFLYGKDEEQLVSHHVHAHHSH